MQPAFLFRRCLILTIVGIAAIANHLFAMPPGESLTIINPGFESNTVSDGCFQVFIPTGWSLFDPNNLHDGNSDAVGGLNADTPYFPAGAPQGEHVALVFMSGDVGQGPMGLRQTLGDVLEPDSMYTLSVQVGNIASGQGPPPCDIYGFFNLAGFPGYQVQLLAGGAVIAQDNNSLDGMIPEGEFRLSTIQVSIGAKHPQLGQPLQVRLINLNVFDMPGSPGIEVDFDDVRLVIGCPATGDLDNDGDVNEDDIAIFVDVLLDNDSDPFHVGRADLNCTGTANGSDIQPFVDILLN